MAEPTILVERHERIATVTLDRPDSANTLNDVLSRELREAMTCLVSARETRVIIVTGAGRHFSGGAARAIRQGPSITRGSRSRITTASRCSFGARPHGPGGSGLRRARLPGSASTPTHQRIPDAASCHCGERA